MPTINSLIKQLGVEYPGLIFSHGDDFYYSPSEKTIFYSSEDATRLLHELGHARLEHLDYSRDINLLKMERDAWEEARQMAASYGVAIEEDTIQDHLDTYRQWLHARSLCPDCSANGLQIDTCTYQCPNCRAEWRVNEARTCGLKRYKLKTPV